MNRLGLACICVCQVAAGVLVGRTIPVTRVEVHKKILNTTTRERVVVQPRQANTAKEICEGAVVKIVLIRFSKASDKTYLNVVAKGKDYFASCQLEGDWTPDLNVNDVFYIQGASA